MEKSSQAASIRAERIKTILKIEDLTQVELADALDMEPQNVSRFLRSGKVSENICRKINAIYPQYRLEWLLGLDDNMTFAEMVHNYIDRAEMVNIATWAIIDNAFKEASEYEGIDGMNLDDVPDKDYLSMLVQLRKYASFLAWNYLKPNKKDEQHTLL